MNSQQLINLIEVHRPLWQRVKPMLDKQLVPQALLFVGPRHAGLLQFICRFIAIIMCEGLDKPCSTCRACQLYATGNHPDVHYLRQDKQDNIIKIDHIRQLQHDVYQTPQCGLKRIVVIEPADKMNVSAANALLKILEEPPLHTIFILLAEQLSNLPATIISRCQHYLFEPLVDRDYLSLGQYYQTGEPREELFNHQLDIITALADLIKKNVTPCSLASSWARYSLDDVLWVLYLITAQLIQIKLFGKSLKLCVFETKLIDMAGSLDILCLFKQIDKINTLIRKINHNITINQLLAVEVLLLGYI